MDKFNLHVLLYLHFNQICKPKLFYNNKHSFTQLILRTNNSLIDTWLYHSNNTTETYIETCMHECNDSCMGKCIVIFTQVQHKK